MMHVSVIIPALDEELSIGRVVTAIPDGLVSDILVIDNGSNDHTVDEAEKAGATVFRESRRGYGHACLLGIDHARALGAEVVVFLDGDFSDHPEEMGRLLGPIRDSGMDLVIGSRTLGKPDPGALLPQARIGNRIACLLMDLIWKGSFTDLGPFRAIRLSALDTLGMRETTYGWTIEMQIRALQEGLQVAEVPVSYRKRIGKSKVTGTVSGTIRASVGILSTIGRLVGRSGRTRGTHRVVSPGS